MHESGRGVAVSRSGRPAVSDTRTSKGTFDDKGLNKCHTSARKYFLLSLFQIPTTDEDDADRGDNDAGYSAKKPAPRAEKPAPKKVEKRTAAEIPRPAGIKAVDWGRELVEQFNLCASPQELDAWIIANEHPLADLKEMAPQVWERVMAVDKQQRETMAAK